MPLNAQQKEFLLKGEAAAKAAEHVFPAYAACEAALESGHIDRLTHANIYGGSDLARLHNNLFGMKQHQHPVFGTCCLPTREFLHSQWVTVASTDWVEYPDWASCFQDRMATLRRLGLRPGFQHYANALAATGGTQYVLEVSSQWSTDPQRGRKVLNIYDEMTGDWNAT